MGGGGGWEEMGVGVGRRGGWGQGITEKPLTGCRADQ